MNSFPYKVRSFDIRGLQGISDKTLEMHFTLYEGYVNQSNKLTEEVSKLLGSRETNHETSPAYTEIKRRLGFEYNGMILHEYYFDNLKKGGGSSISPTSLFHQKIDESFGDYETWKTDFASIGEMRGVGWAVCYQDPVSGRLSNHWISLHEVGNIIGYVPILVMDVWEHAYLLDYKPSDRRSYIESFFSNINWEMADERLRIGPQSKRAA